MKVEGEVRDIVFNDHQSSGCAEIVRKGRVSNIGFAQARSWGPNKLKLDEDEIRTGKKRSHVVRISDQLITEGLLAGLKA